MMKIKHTLQQQQQQWQINECDQKVQQPNQPTARVSSRKYSNQLSLYMLSKNFDNNLSSIVVFFDTEVQRYRPILNSDGSKIRLFEFTARERGNR